MARLLCKCGETLSNSNCPNNVQLHVFDDFEWDLIIMKDSIDPLKIPNPKHDVWRCNICLRLYFFSPDGKIESTYIIEK